MSKEASVGNSTQDVMEILALFERSDFKTLQLECDGVRIELAKDGHQLPRRQASPAAQPALEAEAVPTSAPAPKPAKSDAAQTALAPEPSKSERNVQPAAAQLDPNLIAVRAPMVGNFYRAPSPGEPAFVKVGDQIKDGAVIGLIECMKLFNSVESGCSGTVVEILPVDGQMVEFDQPLVLIRVH